MPASICLRISFRSALSSSERSWRKGVTMAVPHPVKMLMRSSSGLCSKVDLGELEHALLPDDPLRRLERAAREPLATPRRVPQRDRVGGGIESDLVRPGLRAGATGRHVDLARIAGGFH